MNIALINPEYPSETGIDHGGIATYTYVMANALARQGHTVHVLAREGTVADTLAPGVEFHSFNRLPSSPLHHLMESFLSGAVVWESGFSRGAFQTVMNLHRTRPLDIVEIPEYNGMAYAFSRSRCPFFTVIHFHTPSCVVDDYNAISITSRNRAWYRYEKQAAGNSAAFVAPSNAIRDEIIRRWGFTHNKIAIIRHPVDRALFNKVVRRSHSDEKIELLFVGRLERRKGAELLVTSIPAILAVDPRIRLTFAGATEGFGAPLYRETIERNLPELERKRVFFLGPVGREQLPTLYVNSDIFLFPSLFENAPYALFEAMAAGLPIVASDSAGTREIIKHNQNGLLFSPTDPSSLPSCIERLVIDHDLGLQLAKRALTDLQTFHDPDEVARATTAFYSSLSGGNTL